MKKKDVIKIMKELRNQPNGWYSRRNISVLKEDDTFYIQKIGRTTYQAVVGNNTIMMIQLLPIDKRR